MAQGRLREKSLTICFISRFLVVELLEMILFAIATQPLDRGIQNQKRLDARIKSEHDKETEAHGRGKP
ncbi:MAG: hypothetical protein IBX72_04995 [Nitrospirae bacterium]|nr:hypothetical protein [Nitrospirota bacterium]